WHDQFRLLDARGQRQRRRQHAYLHSHPQEQRSRRRVMEILSRRPGVGRRPKSFGRKSRRFAHGAGRCEVGLHGAHRLLAGEIGIPYPRIHANVRETGKKIGVNSRYSWTKGRDSKYRLRVAGEQSRREFLRDASLSIAGVAAGATIPGMIASKARAADPDKSWASPFAASAA